MIRNMRFLGCCISTICAFSCCFTINFYLGSLYSTGEIGNTLAIRGCTIATLIFVTWIGYRYRTAVRPLIFAVSFLVIFQIALQVLAIPDLLWMSPFVACLISALGSVTVTLMFVGLPVCVMRLSLLIAFALSAAILPAFHAFTNLDEAAIREVLLAALACSLVLFSLSDRDVSREGCHLSIQVGNIGLSGWIKAVIGCYSLSSFTSVTIVVSSMILFGFGALERYAMAYGVGYSLSDVTMVFIFFLSLLLLCGTRSRETTSWARFTFFAIWVVGVVGFLLIIAFPYHLSDIFAVVGAFMALVNLPIRAVLLDDVANGHSLPLVLFGSAVLLLFVGHIGGQLFMSALIDLAGVSNIAMPLVLTLALTFSFIAALLFRSITLANPSSKPSNSLQPEYDFAKMAEKYKLTERESEILDLYRQGRSSKHIASLVYLSNSTVKTHIRRAYAKLGVHNKQQLLDLVEEEIAG